MEAVGSRFYLDDGRVVESKAARSEDAVEKYRNLHAAGKPVRLGDAKVVKIENIYAETLYESL